MVVFRTFPVDLVLRFVASYGDPSLAASVKDLSVLGEVISGFGCEGSAPQPSLVLQKAEKYSRSLFPAGLTA